MAPLVCPRNGTAVLAAIAVAAVLLRALRHQPHTDSPARPVAYRCLSPLSHRLSTILRIHGREWLAPSSNGTEAGAVLLPPWRTRTDVTGGGRQHGWRRRLHSCFSENIGTNRIKNKLKRTKYEPPLQYRNTKTPKRQGVWAGNYAPGGAYARERNLESW
uniref:Uncharacterized protein n=1 Tax=Oryza rufipogon TaxID=4529 RepID=A0A0E0RBU4_ORYRU